MKMFESIEKRMADERSPHDGGLPLGQIESARLVVEMIAPARSLVSGGSMFYQPLDGKFRFVGPHLIPGRLVEPYESPGQEPHPFAGMFLFHAQQRT